MKREAVAPFEGGQTIGATFYDDGLVTVALRVLEPAGLHTVRLTIAHEHFAHWIRDVNTQYARWLRDRLVSTKPTPPEDIA